MAPPDNAVKSVIAVGAGRGFTVRGPARPLPFDRAGCRPASPAGEIVDDPSGGTFVITAAHCLPTLPPAMGSSYLHERTYPILGSLDGGLSGIFTECLFVDPVGDLAILDEADWQELAVFAGEVIQYEDGLQATMPQDPEADFLELVGGRPRLAIGELKSEEDVWVLQLDGRWTTATATPSGWHRLVLSDVVDGIQGGMSGSPILNARGEAVGVVTQSAGDGQGAHTSGSNPRLAPSLPRWFRP